MRKLKLIKVVVPEIVAYIGPGSDIDNMAPDYQCPKCKFGLSEWYYYCPCCGNELDWASVRKPSAKFVKLIDRL